MWVAHRLFSTPDCPDSLLSLSLSLALEAFPCFSPASSCLLLFVASPWTAFPELSYYFCQSDLTFQDLGLHALAFLLGKGQDKEPTLRASLFPD